MRILFKSLTSGFVAQTELLTAVTHGTDQQSCVLTVLDCSLTVLQGKSKECSKLGLIVLKMHLLNGELS